MQWTQLLIRKGWHVLRFDFFGTGDSAGMHEEATLGKWRRNIAMAVGELRERMGQGEIVLAGCRLGASLALLEALDRQEINRAIVWAPVVNGSNYLTEIQQHQVELLAPVVDRLGEKIGPTEIMGTQYSPQLLDELRAFDLSTELENKSLNRLLIGGTDGGEEQYGFWRKSNHPHSAIVPHKQLKTIVQWLEEVSV